MEIGMGLKLIRMGRIGKAESQSRTPLVLCWHTAVQPTPMVLVHMQRWANHDCLPVDATYCT